MKKISALLALAGIALTSPLHAISTNDIQIWAGSGTNHAGLVITWNTPQFFNYTTVPAPAANKTMVWGFQFNGTATATQMLDAVLKADRRLYAIINIDPTYGTGIDGLGYNLSGNGAYGVSDGTNTDQAGAFVNGCLNDPNLDVDAAYPLNRGDLFWSGHYGPNWTLWNEQNDNGGFSSSPNRGSSEYAAFDPDFYSWTQGQWESSYSGLDFLDLTDGSWIGLTITAAGYDGNDADPAAQAYNDNEQAPPSPDGTYTAYVNNTNNFAVQIVSSSGVDAMAPYNNAAAMLGAPTLTFVDPSEGDDTNRVSIIDDPFNIAPDGSDIITKIDNGGQVTVDMGRKVYHDPGNPYGVDLIVYGNSFYQASGFASDASDLNTTTLKPVAGHPAIVSVSQDGTAWYTFPTTSVLFPDNAYRWDNNNQSWTAELMNPTKPLDPAITESSLVGGTAAAALDQYLGAAGGSGYNLQASGLPWVQYVRIQPGPGTYTVIDAIAAVSPVAEGDALSVSPGDVASGVTNLLFQAPYDASKTLVEIGFAALNEAARVTTVPLSDFSPFAPAPGVIENACRLTAAPVSGTTPVAFTGSVTLNAGNYSGTGSDLRVLQWTGTCWASNAFLFNPASHQVLLTGVTNSTAFLVSQLSPQLTLPPGSIGTVFQFIPFPNTAYTLQRSTDLTHWSFVNTITSGNTQPVTVQDTNPPPTQAFYRLQVNP